MDKNTHVRTNKNNGETVNRRHSCKSLTLFEYTSLMSSVSAGPLMNTDDISTPGANMADVVLRHNYVLLT